MSVDGLSINFPKQIGRSYRLYSQAKSAPDLRFTNLPKEHIPSDAIIQYDSFDVPRERYSTVSYHQTGGITKLEEYTPTDSPHKGVAKSQELNKTDPKLSIKKNKVSCCGKEYSSAHILNHETGLESVARKKGSEVIGGYEILPTKRTFAQGFKGRLQKLGMAVATDANGCERPVLKNVGEMILKVAKKVK
mgnify:CR=1 FL=1